MMGSTNSRCTTEVAATMSKIRSGGRLGRPFIVIVSVIVIAFIVMFAAARFHTEVIGQETFAERTAVEDVPKFLASDCEYWNGVWVGLNTSKAPQTNSIFDSCDVSGTVLHSQQCAFFDGVWTFREGETGTCSIDVSAAVRAAI
jgi:hypothetical protein